MISLFIFIAITNMKKLKESGEVFYRSAGRDKTRFACDYE